jgi:DUF1680 family protein
LRWSRTRVPFVTSYCCPPNVLRTIAETSGYAYAKTADAVLVNLYGGSKLSTRLGDRPLVLTQTTDYPWDGRVRIVLGECPPSEFALKLRIPGWASAAAIRLNGRPVDETFAAPGSYAEVRRSWKPGDFVELDLPMPATLLEANPLVEEARNQVAVKRGPLVYCLESPDLAGDVRVQDIAVPADVGFTARRERNLLGDVIVLEAPLVARKSPAWNDGLYRPRQAPAETAVRTRLIPYYAWSNRGPSEMSVWLPLD